MSRRPRPGAPVSALVGLIGAAAVLRLALVEAGAAIPFPTTDPRRWLVASTPDLVVMSLVRGLAILLAGHTALVFGLTLSAWRPRSRRPNPSAGAPRVARLALRLAGPLWRRTVAATLGLAITVSAPLTIGVAGVRSPAVAVSIDAVNGADEPPILVRVGPPRPLDAPTPRPSVGTVPSGRRPAEPPRASTVPTAAPTTAAPTAAPPSTAVPTTAPTTTAAPTTAPPTTAAPSTAAPTTAPPTTATPTTAAPSTATPTTAPAGPPPRGAVTATRSWTVRPGDHFWSIAERVVAERTGLPQPEERIVARYWRSLVAANADRLPHPGDPDLLYPGSVLRLP